MLWPGLSLWGLVAATAIQVDLTAHEDPGDLPTRTIIDILSDNPQYSVTLHLLQRHGLVPILNNSWNVTLLAPVNSAYVDLDLDEISYNQLLYLVLNQTLVIDSGQLVIVPTFYVNEGVPAQMELEHNTINHGPSQIVEQNLMGSPYRGVVQGIDRVVELPASLCLETFARDDTSIWTQLASLGNLCTLLGTDLTMFIPSNHAMSLYSKVELLYLFSGSASADRRELALRHTMKGQLQPGTSYIEMLDGTRWSLDDHLVVNGTYEPLQAWLPASNGLYHVYNNVFGDVIKFTPEKYILALRGFAFVRALKLYGYEYLIDGSNTDLQTLLVPVMSVQNLESVAVADEEVLYQVLNSIDLNATDALLETKMSLKSGKYPQKAHFVRSDSGKMYINWQLVTSEKFEIGNTSIITMDGKLTAPARLQMAVGPLLLGSYSLTYLDTLGLLDLPTDESWTVLLPTRDAWEDQILLKYYFDSHPNSLRALFNNFIFRTPFYSTSANQTVTTIDGYLLEVKLLESPSFQTGLAFQLDEVVVKTEVTDVLFDNGVVHCISNLQLRQELEIDALDLIDSGHRSVFIELLRHCDMGYVFEGNYTIIVPDPVALSRANYTLDSPINELEAMLKLHIIESNPIEQLKNGDIFSSLAGEPTLMEQINEDVYSIALLYGKGQRVFVNGWGNTNGRDCAGSTVLFIDTLISPTWLQQPILRPPFRLKTHTLLLIGIVLGVIVCALVAVAAVYIFLDDKVLQMGPQSAPSQGPEPYRDEDEERPTSSAPVRTPGISQGREYGQHLDLP